MKCKEINEIWPALYCNISSALYGYACIVTVFFSYLVSECYVQKNDVLFRLKCITGGWGNTTYVTLSKLFTHEIISAQTYSMYNQYTLHKAGMTATLLRSRITWTIILLYSMKRSKY